MNLRTVIDLANELRCRYHDAVRMAICAGIALALLIVAIGAHRHG